MEILHFSKDLFPYNHSPILPNHSPYKGILTKTQHFQHDFFLSEKKYIFFGVGKKIGYIFEVKNSNLSNYEVFSAFWAL